MKTTKERFSRIHQLCLRRQGTASLPVKLFFKTICRNRRIKSRRPIRVVAALLAWLNLGPFAAHATDFIWHSPGGDSGAITATGAVDHIPLVFPTRPHSTCWLGVAQPSLS